MNENQETKVDYEKPMRRFMQILHALPMERMQQLKKFGVQEWPCLDQTLLHRDGVCTPVRMTQNYEIPSEERCKMLVAKKLEQGTLTYADIALEELSEAISTFNAAQRRQELIQLATVVVAWIDKIDTDIEEINEHQYLRNLYLTTYKLTQEESKRLRYLTKKHKL